MIIHVQFDRKNTPDFDNKDYNLSGDELISFLKSEGIGFNGLYYRVKHKIFEDLKDGLSLYVIAKEDVTVTI